MMIDTKEPDESITFRIPISLAAKLRAVAHDKQISLREAEIRAVSQYVARAERERS